jgi:nucleotide-binding universal stress UspA family protein
MFKKVIIGDDGLAGGVDAVALAEALAPDAELLLASTYPYDSVPSRFALLGFGNALREETTTSLSQAREAGGIPDARIVAIGDSSPSRGLHRLAEEEHADLIVIGSAHHGPVGRMFLGDVSRGVLHGSPCPVAVAPRGFSAGAPHVIGVAYDGSPEAQAALAAAAELARGLGARLSVREIVESNMLMVGGYAIPNLDEILDDVRGHAQDGLEEVCADLGPDLEIDATAVTGLLAEELDKFSAKVDLLVSGSRCWGPVRRVTLGSTADRLIHHAPCPVLVVPRIAVRDEPTTSAEGTASA